MTEDTSEERGDVAMGHGRGHLNQEMNESLTNWDNRDSSSSMTVPRYLQLYEQGMKKKSREEHPVDNHKQKSRSSTPSRLSVNRGCERLYALSDSKQKEGKQRRLLIEKSKEKPPPPITKKIPLSQATKMYERSMHHLIAKEMKLMDVAHENRKTYESLLVPQSGNGTTN